MIQPNLPRVVRRNFQRQSLGKQNQVQHAINRLLWKIIASQGGKLTVSCFELDKLPDNAAIKADYDVKTHTMTMVSAVRSGIVTPDEGIITE